MVYKYICFISLYNKKNMILPKYYQINNKFFASITESKHEFRVKFGGIKQCINISVYKDDVDPNINGISFDKKCSKDADMISGEGTASRAQRAVEMTKIAIKFVKAIFPDVRNFMLKDHSKITCEYNNTVPLYYFYLIKHGKTWYQSKFNAKPFNKDDIQLIKEAVDYMKNEPMLQLEEFNKKYIVGSKCRLKNFVNFIKEIYNKSKSYHEFINTLISENDCASRAQCAGILQYWFSYFFSKHCTFNFGESLWVISSKTIEKWPEITYKETNEPIKFLSIHEGGYAGGDPADFKL